jgi:hypothetical protein
MKVKVRIAVAVDHRGRWVCSGWELTGKKPPEDCIGDMLDDLAPGEQFYFVTAELDTPEPQASIEVEGSVEKQT